MDKTLGDLAFLPDDVLFHILTFAHIPVIVLISTTCHGLKARIASVDLWRKISLQLPDYPEVLPPTFSNVVEFYKTNNCWFDATTVKNWKKGPSPSQGFLATIFSKRTIYHCALIGPSKSGKSTILHKLKTGLASVSTPPQPTTSCTYENLTYKKVEFRFLEISGRDFPHFHCYKDILSEFDAFVFVVDSNDRETLPDVHRVTKEPPWLEKKPRLHFCNKQDLPNACSVAEVTHKVDLHSLRNIKWYIQATCAVSGDGLYEGLDWLTHACKQ